MVARNGDWCIAPFQCDSCWFLNIHSRRPRNGSFADKLELTFIRRVNLDMFWSRESSTVLGTTSRLNGIIKGSTSKGRPVPLEPFPPWPLGDSAGMGIALLMLEKSIEPGRNSADYKQFDSCRPLRSAASNVFAASSLGASKPLVLKSTKGEVLHLFQGAMQSVLMERFALGMKIRMPVLSNRNKPLMGAVVKVVLEFMDREWSHPDTGVERKRLLAMCGGYIVTTYGYSLRGGNEGFWVDASRLRANMHLGAVDNTRETPHVCVALLGCFKGEDGDRMHVFPLANVTSSGI